MFKLLVSVFKRIVTAVTSPFRAIIVRVQRMFNINVITAKLITPLTKKVKELITLKPQSREDYYIIGRHWVFKKLFLTLVLVLCAGILIYFTMFAPKLPPPPTTDTAAVATDVSYNYDDMALREFNGVANIRASDGRVVYTGEIAAGVCKGNGSLYDRSGRLLYAGGFEQNKYSGKGIGYYPSGKVKYEGGFADNLYQGEGVLYSAEGTVVYTGSFAGGVYSGAGKLYADQNLLLYEGSFADGKYHGDGLLYYSDGTVKYKGAFFQGMMQGQGSLYGKTGKLLYTGDVYDNAINYRSLVHSTLADVDAAFAETPRIFYTDTDSAFVYEQAGVIVTAGCRVLVDTWEKPESGMGDGTMYYMPDGTTPAPDVTPPDVVSLPPGVVVLPSCVDRTPPAARPLRPTSSGLTLRSMSLDTPQKAPLGSASQTLRGGSPLTATPVAWYVADDTGNIQYGDTGSTGNENSSSNPPAQSGGTTSPSSSGAPEISVVLPESDEKRPDFVQKSNTLYFEIDKNVWQSEAELDRSKVEIQKITVFDPQLVPPPKDAVEFGDNIPPSMEDCVAIDFIRQQTPTAFPQVMFESDNQNRLFVKLANINFAAAIRSRAYLSDALTYRYCYPTNGKDPLFFSIAR